MFDGTNPSQNQLAPRDIERLRKVLKFVDAESSETGGNMELKKLKLDYDSDSILSVIDLEDDRRGELQFDEHFFRIFDLKQKPGDYEAYSAKYSLEAGQFAVCCEHGFFTDAVGENHTVGSLMIFKEQDGALEKVHREVIWQHVD